MTTLILILAFMLGLISFVFCVYFLYDMRDLHKQIIDTRVDCNRILDNIIKIYKDME